MREARHGEAGGGGRNQYENVLNIGSGDHKVYAFDASTGSVKWSYTTGGGVFSSPAVVDGVASVGSGDKNVYAVDLPGRISTERAS